MTVSVGVCGTMIEGYNEGWIDFGGVARSAASAGSHLKRFSRSSRARLMSAMGHADATCIIGLVRFVLNSGCRGAERFPSLKLACKCYLRRYLGPNEHHLQKENLA
jgi:hypothetical protein